MENVFIVMRNNNESYEDNQSWAVAAFSTQLDAEAHAKHLKLVMDEEQVIATALLPAFEEESNSLYKATPFTWDDDLYMDVTHDINKYLNSKYPGVSDINYCDHYFFVSNAVPFIK